MAALCEEDLYLLVTVLGAWQPRLFSPADTPLLAGGRASPR
jgi:hypothetical protein